MNYAQLARQPLSPQDLADGTSNIADAAVVGDIESEAIGIDLEDDERTWYDIRPMLDEREHAPPVIDQAVMALRYALSRGLISYHPTQAHLVRMVVPF